MSIPLLTVICAAAVALIVAISAYLIYDEIRCLISRNSERERRFMRAESLRVLKAEMDLYYAAWDKAELDRQFLELEKKYFPPLKPDE